MNAQRLPVRVALILALAAVAAGFVFRFAYLDRKLFWQDEAYSALRIGGYADRDVRALFDGQVHTAADVLRFQSPAPGSDVGSVVRTIAKAEPQRGPAFYVLVRLWVERAGVSVGSYRMPAAVLGVLGILLAFLLGRAAGGGVLAGAVLAAFVALSPFHVRYAQEAREYVLYADAVLAATWALLVALERQSLARWLLYAVIGAIGLYTDPLFGLVIVGHAAFVLLARRNAMLGFGGATAGALALFAPWIAVMIAGRSAIASQTGWADAPYPLQFLLTKWAFNLGAVFFDAEYAKTALAICLLPVALAAVYALVKLVQLDRYTTLLALAVALPTLLFFGGRDLFHHGHIATIPRYLVPVWIGLELAVAAGIARTLAGRSQVGLALTAFAVLLAAGAGSDAISARTERWWDNHDFFSVQAVARAIEREPDALVVSEQHFPFVLELSHYLTPSRRLLLFTTPHVPGLADRAGPVYLFAPSAAVRAAVAANSGRALANVSPADDAHSFGRGDPAYDPTNSLWALAR